MTKSHVTLMSMSFPRGRSLDVFLTVWIAAGALVFFRQFWGVQLPMLTRLLW
jgi:hypothetical protein